MPLRGACGIWHRQALVGRQRDKANLPFTRRTISAVSAAAARCRCRGRTPMPLRGDVRRAALASFGWSAKPFILYNKAELPFSRRTISAVSAAAARCRCRVRTPMPLRGACGIWHRQALVGRQRTKANLPFTRRTISAVSAANECEGIILRQQNNEER